MSRRSGRKGRRAASGSSARISDDNGADALLPLAVRHHQSGDLERARALYEQLITADPLNADGLQYFGILCGQCGENDRAEALIRRAIAVKADVAPYHDNLGTVLEHAGRLDDAIKAYETADALEPGDAQRAWNLGVVLERLGRVDEAQARYQQILDNDPGNVDCRFALANLAKARGQMDEAVASYRHIISLVPKHVGARINLGNALQDDGEAELALAEYRVAIAHEPDNATAHHNQGRALLRVGRADEAQRAFETALRNDPQLDDARAGLAQALENVGRLDRAWAAWRAVCASDPDNAQARAGLMRVARVLPPVSQDDLLIEVLLSAIAAREARAADFARVLGVQLAAKAGLFNAPSADDRDALHRAMSLRDDPLFVVVLEQCVNVVAEIERWLCCVRRALLNAEDQELVGAEPVLRALALQCAANEYAFAVTDEEIGVIDAVLAQLDSQSAQILSASTDSVRDLLLCACYAPLTELWGAVGLAAQNELVEPWLAPILQRAVTEPLREQVLAQSVRELAPIEDEASKLVRAQYEDNPYPRWHEMAPTPNRSSEQSSTDPVSQVLARSAAASILVVGCGTGQEPLALAMRWPRHRIVAMDLSRASLAYGMRMAEDFGIESVDFVHGDLLDVDHLDERFDVITASGVLHHLADPLAGWRAIRRCLAPRGVMKVALYSRQARSSVNRARQRIAELGLAADAHGVREFRARVLAGDEPQLLELLDSEDFYTTSVCRDLVFHPVEHQFDLPQIAAMLETLKLRFEGFELPHPLVRREFAAAQVGDERDLDAWARFEAGHPQTFEGMYVMWCTDATSPALESRDE